MLGSATAELVCPFSCVLSLKPFSGNVSKLAFTQQGFVSFKYADCCFLSSHKRYGIDMKVYCDKIRRLIPPTHPFFFSFQTHLYATIQYTV